MKAVPRFCIVSLLTLIYIPSFSQQAPLTYIESSVGLSNPEWEGGDSELEFADINQDGHPDIVSVGDHGNPGIQSGEQGIMVFFNSGSGQWNVSMQGDLGYGGIAVGDVNNDGHLDVGYGIHHNYSSTDLGDQLLEVALGNGTGTGWVPWDNGLATAGEDWGMFGTDFGDVDNDGDLDIGSISFGCCAGVHVYLNNMDGTWTHSWGFLNGNASDIFQFGDINNDGNLDIATAYQNGTIYFGDGTGDFVLAEQNLPPAGNLGRVGISLGDVDGDGGMDLAYADNNGGVHVFIWNDDEEQWDDWTGNLPASGTAELAQLCDMNADGDIDLAVFGEAHFQLWLGDGKGDWTADATFTTQEDGTGHAFRTGGDVDHNGRPDIALLVEIGDWISYQNFLKCYKESSPVFTLNIKPVYPRGNEFFWQNCIRDIKWVSAVPTGQASTVTLELSVNGPEGPFSAIAENIPNNGNYQWLVPQENSLNCYVRYTVMTATDTSSSVTPAPFVISDGTAGTSESTPYIGGLEIFPNPARCGATIRIENMSSELVSLTLYDVTGHSMETSISTLSCTGRVRQYSIHAPEYPGMYFLKCHSHDEIQTYKIQVVR